MMHPGSVKLLCDKYSDLWNSIIMCIYMSGWSYKLFDYLFSDLASQELSFKLHFQRPINAADWYYSVSYQS